MSTSLYDHLWWLASRASGLVALGLITGSVLLGLTMSGRIMRKPGRAKKLLALHEQLALTGLVAIAVHGITLLGDTFINPGLKGILVPGMIGYRPFWVGLGIVAGYLAAALGLSYYVRRRIGPRLWRKAHRATIVVYGLSVVHTLGAGTDAATPWLRWWLLLSVPLVLILLAIRMTEPSRRRSRIPARPPVTAHRPPVHRPPVAAAHPPPARAARPSAPVPQRVRVQPEAVS